MHELLIIVASLLGTPPANPPATPPAKPATVPASVIGGTPLTPPSKDGPTVLQGSPMGPGAPAITTPGTPGTPATSGTTAPPALPASLSPASAAALAADAQRRETMRELTRQLFPEPITEAELDWWAVSLDLGPDAVAFARDLRARYESKVRGALVPEAGAMVMASYDWSEDGTRLLPRWTPVHVSMVVRRAQLVVALRDAEAQLARELVPIVPPERQRDARRLFFRRQFEVGAAPTAGTLASLDVVSLIEECRLPETELAVIAPVLDAYVAELGPTMRARALSALDREVQEAQLLTALGPMWQAVVTDEDRQSIDEELAMLRADHDAASAPLRRLNRTTLLVVASQLSSRSAATVLDRLWLRVHPTQFEDERALVRLVMEAIEHPSATQSDRDGRINFVATLRTRLLPLGLEVAEIADLTAGSPLVVGGGDSDSRAGAVARLETEIARLESLARRRTICLDAADGLESMLNAPESELRERCRAFRQALETRNSADTWMLRRCRTRVAEIHAREAEEVLAAESAELEAMAESASRESDGEDSEVGGGGSGNARSATPPSRQTPRQTPGRPAGAQPRDRPTAPMPPRSDVGGPRSEAQG